MDRNELSRLHLEPEEKRSGAARRRTVLGAGAVVVVVAVVVAAVVLQRRGGTGPTERPADSARTAAAQSATAARQSGPAPIAAGGYVEALRRAALYPGRDGIVSRVYVALGQRVRAGTLLLELDTTLAAAEAEASRADVSATRAELDDARQAQQRLEELARSAAVTEDEVNRGRYKVQSLAAQVQALEARQHLAEGRLALSYLRAPFDGAIVRVDLEPGEVVSLFGVQSGVGAIEIADLSEIRVRIDVPEDRIGSVALGAPAEVVADALGPAPLKAVVVQIAPVADRQSNTVEVAVRVIDPPPLLRPDMSARVTIRPKGDQR